ncbi:MAG: hypothetical protein JJU05_05210 [Verrucomicrobia bacterium]|nr:hypothetical protein [Verrucomicrobiota bacterium]MCH8525810.1 glycosyltransferase family 39 protein [Kiritimatiellia bacterium]
MKTQNKIILCLLLPAAALRIYGAWAFRYITDADGSVVALMARHMAEGREFPIFFYGQHYMGSLEPMVSALFVLLLGPSGFAVCLGPALMAVAALLVLCLWASDAGGVWAGGLALGLCVLGPYRYFLFQFAPRGGYMIALLCSGFLLWQAARISVRSRSAAAPELWPWFGLGLVAGAGLWSHAIVFSAVMAALVVLLLGWRGAFWRHPRPILAGLGGFLLGFSPWWIYNLLHGWASLEMFQNTLDLPLREGMSLLWKRWVHLVAHPDWSRRLSRAVALGYLLPAAAGMLLTLRDLRLGWTRSLAARLAGLLFFLFSAAFFCRSTFATLHTARYLLPLVPVVALFAGVAMSRIRLRALRGAAAGLVLLLLLSQIGVLRTVYRRNQEVPERYALQEQLRQSLEAEGVETLYTTLPGYHLNFMMGGQFTFAHTEKIFYLPHSEKAEFSSRSVFQKDLGGLRSFLAAAGGQARLSGSSAGHFLHDFVPPRDELQPLPAPAAILFNGIPAPQLADLSHGTGRAPDPERETQTVEVIFRHPVALRRIRLAFDHPVGLDDPRLPDSLSVEVLPADGTEWKSVVGMYRPTRLFWSGPRPFLAGHFQRSEVQLSGDRIQALRIHLNDAGRPDPDWRLVTLGLFEGAGEAGLSEADALPQVLAFLEAQGVKRLYADRWASNQVHVETRGRIQVPLDPRLARPGGLHPDDPVSGGGPTVFLTRGQDAQDCKTLLTRLRQPFEEMQMGPWILLICPAIHPESDEPLFWTGYGLRSRSGSAGGEEGAPAKRSSSQ